jgi:pyrroloquinoline quinone biosynthesis protein B
VLEVLVLGTAAGGGFPQWNCACANCRDARAGLLPPRLQSSLAVSGNGRDWHLVNASPDVTRQLERFVWPRRAASAAARQSPVCSVFLTNADLDHTLGLFQLREGDRIRVTAPAAVHASLERGLALDRVLGAYGGVAWSEARVAWQAVDESGLEVRAVKLTGGGAPRYDAGADAAGHAVGYLFRRGDAMVGVFPDVAQIDAPLRETLAQCDRVWFDGTFWAEDEMLPLSGRSASAMGHAPIGGDGGSLETLAGLGGNRAAYLHINNTNPILRPDSDERRAVESAGVRVAEDGEHFVVSAHDPR